MADKIGRFKSGSDTDSRELDLIFGPAIDANFQYVRAFNNTLVLQRDF